jgi:hypothetical protein
MGGMEPPEVAKMDNWAPCPKCKGRKKAESDAAMEKAQALYGKVPPDEWQEAMRKATALSGDDGEGETTFREDWDIGAWSGDGTFEVDYRGSCEECGLAFDFKHEVRFWPEDEHPDAGATS